MSISDKYYGLNEGQVFKNYKELCEFLNERDDLKGKSRILQMKQFDRYFTYKKDGHKITIETIYSEPLEETQRGLYSPVVQKLIVDYLCRIYLSGNREVLTTISDLFVNTGFTKTEFKEYKYKQSELATLLGVEENIISDFYYTTNSKISDYFVNALKSLVNRSIIRLSKTYIIIDKSDKYQLPRVPTFQEESLIYEADFAVRSTLTPKGYVNKDSNSGLQNIITSQHIVAYGLREKYTSLIGKYLKDNGGDYIHLIYTGYAIMLTKNIVGTKETIDKYILKNRREISDDINSVFVENSKLKYSNLHNKAKEELPLLDKGATIYKAQSVVLREQESYLSDGIRLIDATINKKESFDNFLVPKILLIQDNIINIDEGIPF